MNTLEALEERDREAELREAYASRREPDKLYRFYKPEVPELQLADLIAQHQIHLDPYDAIVYARIDKREVGVKYSAVGGDKAKAVRLAVREVLRLVGVTQ